MEGPGVGVFGVVIEKGVSSFDAHGGEEGLVEESDGPFLSGDVLLDQAEVIEFKTFRDGERKFGGVVDEADAEAGSLGVGFDDERIADVAGESVESFDAIGFVNEGVFGSGDAGEEEAFLGGGFAESDTRGGRSAAGVRDVPGFEQGLHLAVFSVFAVQGDEGDVEGLEIDGFEGEIGGIEDFHSMASFAESSGDISSAVQADFPFRGDPSGENNDA